MAKSGHTEPNLNVDMCATVEANLFFAKYSREMGSSLVKFGS